MRPFVIPSHEPAPSQESKRYFLSSEWFFRAKYDVILNLLANTWVFWYAPHQNHLTNTRHALEPNK